MGSEKTHIIKISPPGGSYSINLLSLVINLVEYFLISSCKKCGKKGTWFQRYFFVAEDIFPICSNTLTNHKNVNCKLANVKQIRLHDFRHSCASLLVNKGANIQLVAKYLGHTKVEETLKTYSYLFTSTLDEVVAVIDNLDNKN